MDSDNKQGQDYNRRQEDLPERPKRRRLRWGRVFLLLIFLAVLLTTVFWGAVWIYSNVIHAPETKTVAADDKISKDEALNNASMCFFWVSTTATVKRRPQNRNGRTP